MSKIRTFTFIFLGTVVTARFILGDGLNYLVSAAPVTINQVYSDTTTTVTSLFSSPGFMFESVMVLLLAAGLMVKVVQKRS
ncbi:MAG: hypothetical protein ACTSRU_14670 [Candidatus Hodarchaeales archaeon]